MITRARFAVIPLVILLAGCAVSPAAPFANGNANQAVAESKLVRISNPQVSQSDQEALAAGNRAFAADLYQKLRGQEGNLFFSPYSISMALAMTYGGARGETAQQMAETMRFTLPADRLHPAFNTLDQHLASLGGQTQQGTPAPDGSSGQGFQLNVANSVWGQKGHGFLPAYLDLLAQNYGAGLRMTDFTTAPEAARQAINDWVSQKAQDKIKDLFAPGTIDASTRLVLANAIYFKASWMYPFIESSTRPGTFHLKDGGEVSVPMMTSSSTATTYERGDGFQAVGLPYLDGKTMAVIILPDEGKFDTFEVGLDAARLDAILKGLKGSHVNLTMPKFKVESSFSLNETLIGMGMVDAFDGGKADFSGMDGQHDLFISQVVHKAFVAVDEKGTEAAAATGVAMAASAALNPAEVKADRPFLFLVYESGTGTILFAGRVMNPA